VLAIAGDRIAWVKSGMVFYKPTGPLSGVTTTAVVVWLAAWLVLDRVWAEEERGAGADKRGGAGAAGAGGAADFSAGGGSF